MVFLNCSTAKPGEKGSECQKSCQTLNAECVRTWLYWRILYQHALKQQNRVEYMYAAFYRSVHSVSQAAYVLLAWYQTVKEAVSKRSSVPVHIMERPISLDRLSQWTATPGKTTYPIMMKWCVSSHFIEREMKHCSFLFVALAKAKNGTAQNVNVMGPALYLEKGITSLMMTRNSLLMVTVATTSLRYTTYFN